MHGAISVRPKRSKGWLEAGKLKDIRGMTLRAYTRQISSPQILGTILAGVQVSCHKPRAIGTIEFAYG